LQIDELPDPAEPVVVDGKAIELMAVNGQVLLAIELPAILLIYRNADQV
jgi:hypothetical protein